MSDDGGTLDDLGHLAGDVVDEVWGDLTGMGEVATAINVTHAVTNTLEAGYHLVTGDTEAAGHDLGNALADGFSAIPFHDAIWDSSVAAGHAVGVTPNHDEMWDAGGSNDLRLELGGTPEPPAAPAPYDLNPDVPEA
jgi:hypothetical protein